MGKIILSTAYLGPVQYYKELAGEHEVYIEQHEHFIKQTYRNRCRIYSANGELSLSIPIKKGRTKTLVKDIKIDYNTNWRKIHWKSIVSAYGASPFFEYYMDDLMPFYTKGYNYLLEYNTALQDMVLQWLQVVPKINFTGSFIREYEKDVLDKRYEIHPKIQSGRDAPGYIQVFQHKYGFMPGLSIIDLVFNEGPNALQKL